MDRTLCIRLLGEFSLTCDGVPLTANFTPRLQSLLTYLILHRQAPQARQHLAFLLWPDLSEARARANLRRQLHQLQHTLPDVDHFLIIDAQILQWRPDGPFSLDVAEFEQAASHTQSWSDLQHAIDLYCGDLLPGCYDDWIVPERERLKQRLIETLERLLQLSMDRANYRAAISYAQRLLQIDPLHEEIHRRLIDLHIQNDDRAAALRAYHTCVSILQRDLGVEPGAATRELYERIVNLDASPGVPLEAAFPLVGREHEWAKLQVAWRAASGGHAQLVLLIGDAGIGKTRLADELFRRVNRQGLATALAHCYAAEGRLPYAPIVAWLRARPLPHLEPVWLSEVARLLPEVRAQYPDLSASGPLTEAWQRQRLHEALARAVLGADLPLLLWLEDLQWCDRDSLEWLHYLLRFDRTARLLMVGTLRPEETANDQLLADLFSALRHEQQLIEIALGPLNAADTRQLGAYVVGYELDSTRAECLYQETEGNPLFIIEALRAGDACIEVEALSPTVQAVIAARLRQLSPQAHELMELASTIGREFTFELLFQAAGLDEETVVKGLDELWQRRIIREIGLSAYDFAHGKIREVAYGQLSSARRRLVHRRVAEALTVTKASNLDRFSAQVAVHYQKANLPELAVAFYRRAAVAARHVFANQEAITYLSRALDLSQATAHVERYDLLLDREVIYDVQGMRDAQQRDTMELQRLAHVLGDESRQAEAWLRTARYAESVSDYLAAIRAAQAAIHLAAASHDVYREAAGYLQWGRALWQLGTMEQARAQLEQALQLAQTARLAEIEVDSLYNLACIAEYQGDQQRAYEYAERAVQLYQTLGDRRGESRALNVLGLTSRHIGDIGGAQAYFDQVLQLCREIGDRRDEGVVVRNLGSLKIFQADYAAARSYFEQSVQLCQLSGERRGESESLTALGFAARKLGDLQAACDFSQRALQLARQVNAKFAQGQALIHLGAILTDWGELEQAADQYRQAVTLIEELGNLNFAVEPVVGLAGVLLTQGDLEQAWALTDSVLERLTPATFDEVDEPARVCWTCYRVLRARSDPRARDVLTIAYELLQTQAAHLPTDEARRVFLAESPVNRAIMQTWIDLP